MKIKRSYPSPSSTFFLFGPRAVGKSTWVRERFPTAFEINLLRQQTFLQLQANPSHLEALLTSLAPNSWVFIDEIQKLPALLDEVHHFLESSSFRFILTGSSARKLKRSGANLLAGRALTCRMFPFSLHELSAWENIRERCVFGTLPLVLRDMANAEQILYSYVETYLREEIKEEALVRRLELFQRFLQIAGRMNGQTLNYENQGRELGRSSPIVARWYEILEDTLLGMRLMPYRPGFKVREVGHPKFYWCDPGVARVCAQIAPTDLGSVELGAALETLVLNDLRVYLECAQKRLPIFYYATQGAGEIDFLIETRPKTIDRAAEFVSIEVKSSVKWKRDFEGPSRSLRQYAKKSHQKMIGVYLGTERLSYDGFEIYPLADFVAELFSGKLI